MYKYLLYLFSFLALVISCSENNRTKISDKDIIPMNTDFSFVGDSVELPVFEIQIDLTENANKKLEENRETIIINASLRGIPKDTTTEEYLEWGHFTWETMILN